MPVRIEAYLALERSLADRLARSWLQMAKTLVPSIIAALRDQDYVEAEKLIAEIDLEDVFEENREYVRYITISAMLFGASRLTPEVKRTALARLGANEVVEAAVENLRASVVGFVEDSIRDLLMDLVAEFALADETAPLADSETQVAKAFNPDQARDEGGKWTSGGASSKPVSEAASGKYFAAVESIPRTEDITAAEEAWQGGVADFGDPNAAFAILQMDGYDDYRSQLEKAARSAFGDQFPAYRLMTDAQAEEWKTTGDVGPVAVTLDPDLAEKFKNFAGFQGDPSRAKERKVFEVQVRPEGILMAGKPEELELVVHSSWTSSNEILPYKKIAKAFNPDEARDASGKWTADGSVIPSHSISVGPKYRGKTIANLSADVESAIAASGDDNNWDSFFGSDSGIRTAEAARRRVEVVRQESASAGSKDKPPAKKADETTPVSDSETQVVEKDFNPGQARDESGKWTVGGGSGGKGGGKGGGKEAPRPRETEGERKERLARAEKMGFDTKHVWHHGTFTEFDEFDQKFANSEAYLGNGFYFSSDEQDVEMNYENPNSPDWTNKIEAKIEEKQNEWDEAHPEEGTTQERIDAHNQINEDIRAQFDKEKAINLKTYLKMEKPLDLTSTKERFEFNFDEEKETESGLGVDAIKALDEVADKIVIGGTADKNYQAAKTQLLEEMLGNDLTAAQLFQKMRGNEYFAYLEREDGKTLHAGQMFKEMAQQMGYDGLIMDASGAFPHIIPQKGVKHAIVFKPNQIRSVAAEFDPKAAGSGKLLKLEKAERFVNPFVSFRERAESQAANTLQLVATLHASRLSAYGFTAEADVLNVSEYEISAQLDNRVCPICEYMDGKVFRVADARASLNEILREKNPEALETLQPWPDQSKDGVEYFQSLSDEELVDKNWHIPPFHPGCRCLLVHVDTVPSVTSTPSYLAAMGGGVGVDAIDVAIAAEEVVQQGAVLVAAEQTAVAYVLGQLDSAGREYGMAFNPKTGEALKQWVGGSNQIRLNPKVDGPLLLGARFVHNHPSSYSLSIADFRVTGHYEMDSIVAMGTDSSKFVGRVKAIPSELKTRYGYFMNNIQLQSDAINSEFLGPLVRSGRVTTQEAMRFFSHHSNDVLREATVVAYGMEIKGPLVSDALDKVAKLVDVTAMRTELRVAFDSVVLDLTLAQKQAFLWI